MFEGSWREEIRPFVRTSQIIIAALTMGPTTFLAVAGVLVARGVFDTPDDSLFFLLHGVLIALVVVEMIVWMIVPNTVVAQGRRRIAAGHRTLSAGPGATGPGAAGLGAFIERTGDAGHLMVLFQTKTIVAAALFEGTAFLAIIVFMVTQSLIALGIAIAMIFGVILQFPTHSAVSHWIDDQLALLQQERSFGS